MSWSSGVSDPRLRLLADTNHGPAHARNQGCRAARATGYMAFLDADDSWDGEKLLEQTRFLEADPTLVGAGCFMRYVSSSGKVLGETGQRLQPADVRRVAAGELFPFPMSSLIVRRSALERSGLFDESFRYAGSEDLDFLARLAAAGPLQCVPRVLGSYRIDPGSAMARERLRINAEARFVRQRIARRAAGGDLTWDEFRATHRRTWAERRQDLVEVFYRSAALWHGEGRRLRAFGYALLATIRVPGTLSDGCTGSDSQESPGRGRRGLGADQHHLRDRRHSIGAQQEQHVGPRRRENRVGRRGGVERRGPAGGEGQRNEALGLVQGVSHGGEPHEAALCDRAGIGGLTENGCRSSGARVRK